MSYAIPVNEVSLSDIKRFKEAALAAGIARAIAKGIAGSPDEMVWRDGLPSTDFGALAQAATGYTTEFYNTLPGVGAAAWALVFDTATPAGPAVPAFLPDDRIAVFYKIYDAAANPVATAVRFRVGATGATTKASVLIQGQIDNKLESDVYISEPVTYDARDRLFIELYGRVATPVGGEELGFGTLVIERVGGTVS